MATDDDHCDEAPSAGAKEARPRTEHPNPLVRIAAASRNARERRQAVWDVIRLVPQMRKRIAKMAGCVDVTALTQRLDAIDVAYMALREIDREGHALRERARRDGYETIADDVMALSRAQGDHNKALEVAALSDEVRALATAVIDDHPHPPDTPHTPAPARIASAPVPPPLSATPATQPGRKPTGDAGETTRSGPNTVRKAPQLTQIWRQAQVLRALKALGYDPLATPREPPGKPGPKHAVRMYLHREAPNDWPIRGSTLNDAWKILRLEGKIKNPE